MNKTLSGLSYLRSLAPWKGDGGFGLTGIREVLERLGNPQDSVRSVHIAGTNGKGSVSAAVSAILGASGFSVGLNTSPHLERMNERFVVDGNPVEDSFIGDFANEVKAASVRAVRELTFHEAITAIGFLGFRELGLDWMVIEVGLGGLLDASNVISRPEACAIVTIDFDHQHILGDTLAEIAVQKAGILKKGSPLVSGRMSPDAIKAISRVVAPKGISWLRFGTEYGIEHHEGNKVTKDEFWLRNGMQELSFPISSQLLGEHQAHNMAVASALGIVVGCGEAQCAKGIESVFWPARLEELKSGEYTFKLDCAHNPAGISTLLSYLKAEELSGIDITFGVLDTKNWKEMVRMLAPVVRTWRVVSPESDRALPLHELCAYIRQVSGPDISIIEYGKEYDRWFAEILRGDPAPTYFVAGSMYLVGHLRGIIGALPRSLWQRTVLS